MNVLLAIKPEFAEKILNGKKNYEFRRTGFQDASEIELVFLYSSAPDSEIVGVFTSNRVVEAPPEELWDLFGGESGIEDRSRFLDYFEGTETGHAIEIDDRHRFDTPIDPKIRFSDFSPPMSFIYLDDNRIESLQPAIPDMFKEDTTEMSLTQYQTRN